MEREIEESTKHKNLKRNLSNFPELTGAKKDCFSKCDPFSIFTKIFDNEKLNS